MLEASKARTRPEEESPYSKSGQNRNNMTPRMTYWGANRCVRVSGERERLEPVSGDDRIKKLIAKYCTPNLR